MPLLLAGTVDPVEYPLADAEAAMRAFCAAVLAALAAAAAFLSASASAIAVVTGLTPPGVAVGGSERGRANFGVW